MTIEQTRITAAPLKVSTTTEGAAQLHHGAAFEAVLTESLIGALRLPMDAIRAAKIRKWEVDASYGTSKLRFRPLGDPEGVVLSLSAVQIGAYKFARDDRGAIGVTFKAKLSDQAGHTLRDFVEVMPGWVGTLEVEAEQTSIDFEIEAA